MAEVPLVETPRLLLRPFRLRDLQAYAAMCADQEVMRHIGAGGPVERDVAWRHMALFLGSWALLGHGMWALERRSDGVLIGRAGFLDPEGWPGCELGWLLARDAWGHGYAFEAARAALAFGRRELGLRDVISLIRPDNTRSLALAERLGARSTGPIEFMGHPALLFRHVATRTDEAAAAQVP
jgi:RimJ/RimL family protein N-acetyltransferase